jgi:hypothetical protein
LKIDSKSPPEVIVISQTIKMSKNAVSRIMVFVFLVVRDRRRYDKLSKTCLHV